MAYIWRFLDSSQRQKKRPDPQACGQGLRTMRHFLMDLKWRKEQLKVLVG